DTARVLVAVERPARDDDLRPAPVQVAGGKLAHLPRAEEQRSPPLRSTELAHPELDGRRRDGLRQLVQLCLGAHALAGTQRVLEEAVQERRGGAAAAGGLVRVAHLAEDLGLARD